MVIPMSWHPATAHDDAMVGYTSRTKLTVPGGTSTVPESAGCAPPDEQAPAASAANKMTSALCLASSRATATSSKPEAYHRRSRGIMSDSEPDWAAWSREAVRLMQARNDAWIAKFG